LGLPLSPFPLHWCHCVVGLYWPVPFSSVRFISITEYCKNQTHAHAHAPNQKSDHLEDGDEMDEYCKEEYYKSHISGLLSVLGF
jgi:hypothetical protein